MKHLFIILFTCFSCHAMAQGNDTRQVVASAGGFGQASNVLLSYTVGEPVIETYKQSSIVLTQGFQQSEQQPVGIDAPSLDYSVTAYPNPTQAIVTVAIKGNLDKQVYGRLVDIRGRVLAEVEGDPEGPFQQQMVVDLSSYADGHYFIQLYAQKGNRHEVVNIQKMR